MFQKDRIDIRAAYKGSEKEIAQFIKSKKQKNEIAQGFNVTRIAEYIDLDFLQIKKSVLLAKKEILKGCRVILTLQSYIVTVK